MASQKEIKQILTEMLKSLKIVSNNIAYVVNGLKQLIERLDK